MKKSSKSRYRSIKDTEMKVRLGEIYFDCQTILLNSHDISEVDHQVKVHARYLEFVIGLVPILEKKSIKHFKKYVDESHKRKLIPDAFASRWKNSRDTDFKYLIELFFSKSNFYTLPIDLNAGFQMSPKITNNKGIYWNLSSPISGRVDDADKCKVIFISHICQGNIKEWVNHYPIGIKEQICYERFLFSEKCTIENLLVGFDVNLTMSEVNILNGDNEHEIKNVFRSMQHRLRFKVYVKNKEQYLSEEFVSNAKILRLFDRQFNKLSKEQQKEVMLCSSKMEEDIIKYSTIKRQSKKENISIIENEYLRVNNTEIPLVISIPQEAINFIKSIMGETKTIGYLNALIKTKYKIENELDYLCETHKNLGKKLIRLKRDADLNFYEIAELNKIYFILCLIFPQYKEEIIHCNSNNFCLRTLIQKNEQSNNILSKA